MRMVIIIGKIDKVRWLRRNTKNFDLQPASSKKGARKTNLKQDKEGLFYSKRGTEAQHAEQI